MDRRCVDIINVPEEANYYIKQHRTRLKEIPDAREAYIDDIWNDYASFRDYIPEKLESVLDIGCGLGLIDVFLYKIYGRPRLNLLDGTGEGDNKFDYYEKCDLYNDMGLTIKTMELNGVDDFNIIEPYYDGKIKADMIISLYSWCFHYPVETYLNLAKESLTKDGIMILEVKRNKGNRKILEENFDLMEVE